MATKDNANVPEVAPMSPFHILFSNDIVPKENWNDWLKLWFEARTLSQYISRLHCGFDASMEWNRWNREKEYDEIDRLIFYFWVAEGWRDTDLLCKPGDRNEKYHLGYDKDGRRIDKDMSEVRQMISSKAFEMLCSNLFNTDTSLPARVGRDEDFHPVWYVVTSERLFPHVKSFFRVQEQYAFHPGENLIMPNLRRSGCLSGISNNEKVAVEFLLNLARFIWRWGPGQTPYFGEREDAKRQAWETSVKIKRDRLDEAKPWMIEVLDQLGRLDILREWLLKLDKPCLTKLKEIAFRNKLYKYERDEERNVETLDEACFLDSKAAWLLKEYEVKKKESDRLSKIREAKRKKTELDRTIADLSGKK